MCIRDRYTGMNMDGLRQSFRPQAERQVKVRLALEKIAQLENIQPTDEEIEAEYEKLAKNYELDVEKVKSFIPKEELVKDIAAVSYTHLDVYKRQVGGQPHGLQRQPRFRGRDDRPALYHRKGTDDLSAVLRIRMGFVMKKGALVPVE